MEAPRSSKISFPRSAILAPVERVELRDHDIEETLAYWIERLGIQDWRIDFEWVHGFDMHGDVGQCAMTYSKQAATLRLLAHGDTMEPTDDEQVLVHELLHVRIAAIHSKDWDDRPADTVYYTCVEHPIERLAWLLVTLRRSGSHVFSWERDREARAREDHQRRQDEALAS